MLDFEGKIEDHLLGMTHIIRGKDLVDCKRRLKYHNTIISINILYLLMLSFTTVWLILIFLLLITHSNSLPDRPQS